MNQASALKFKIASEETEFEQIYKLNYKTFVEEIPQHEPNPTRKLVDKFHHENTYIVCLRNAHLVGMVALRDKRPFSLDDKIANLDSYLPLSRSILEIRLLAVEKGQFSGRVLQGLLTSIIDSFENGRYDLALITGTIRQLRLYKNLGFVPFGPIIGKPGATFQPMYITAKDVNKLRERSVFSNFTESPQKLLTPANLLPGPVGISWEVKRVFGDMPVSHRSEPFVADFQQIKKLLCRLVGARNVEIFVGSGTLANDVIAAQLSLNPARGLVLSNGEFGERLIEHVARTGLPFRTFQAEYGDCFERQGIEGILDNDHDIEWIWAAHCESSTGVLNDIDMLKNICAPRKIKLCMDCISSIGTVPINLSSVFLASTVSGKGLGSFPGLSMVFYNHKIRPATILPRYLDLGLYAACQGIPFTTSSNLVYALKTALDNFLPDHYRDIVNLSTWLRTQLQAKGFSILASESHASPAIITIVLPRHINSGSLGQHMKELGYILSYQSAYLLRNNWIQISLMGDCSQNDIAPLIDILGNYSPSKV